VTNADFTRALATALKRPAILPVPAFALGLAMGEAASMLLSGQRCIPAALNKLGFTFAFPRIEDALADIIPLFKTPQKA
jgi:NAD dependent epimerase/dehydratase family enzyme